MTISMPCRAHTYSVRSWLSTHSPLRSTPRPTVGASSRGAPSMSDAHGPVAPTQTTLPLVLVPSGASGETRIAGTRAEPKRHSATPLSIAPSVSLGSLSSPKSAPSTVRLVPPRTGPLPDGSSASATTGARHTKDAPPVP